MRKIVECCNFTVTLRELKVKQCNAMASLLEGKKVLALLSTGFGKSYFPTVSHSGQNTMRTTYFRPKSISDLTKNLIAYFRPMSAVTRLA